MFPTRFFPVSYYAPRYFPRNGEVPVPTPAGGAAGGAGRPWPDRTLNILLPRRVLLDDEDVLMVLLDD